jgi:hypothetical protein
MNTIYAIRNSYYSKGYPIARCGSVEFDAQWRAILRHNPPGGASIEYAQGDEDKNPTPRPASNAGASASRDSWHVSLFKDDVRESDFNDYSGPGGAEATDEFLCILCVFRGSHALYNMDWGEMDGRGIRIAHASPAAKTPAP